MAHELVNIPIELNRASVGDSDHPFVVIKGRKGVSGTPAYPPINLISVDEQRLLGGTLSGHLVAKVLAESNGEVCVDVESEGGILRFWVDKTSGEVVKKVDMLR